MDLFYSKKFLIVSLLLIIIVGLTGCENMNNTAPSPEEDENLVDPEGVLLQGTFSQDSSNTQAITQSKEEEVKKVMLVYATGYEIHEVIDGKFAIDMKKNEPAGIAFLNNNDEYLGFLTLEDGLSSIPPQYIDEETEVIDFGNITFEGEKAVPENNPVGETIEITETQKSMLATSNSLFAAGLESPDVIEFLTKDNIDWFELIVDYSYQEFKYVKEIDNKIDYAKTFGQTYPELGIEYPFFLQHRFRIRVKNIENTGNIILNYPGYDKDISVKEEDNAYYSANWIDIEDIKQETGNYTSSSPIAGTYEIQFREDLKINFSLPENFQQLIKQNTFIIVPTMHLTENQEGAKLIEKITWEYMTNSGEEITSEQAASIIMEDRDFTLAFDFKNGEEKVIKLDPYENSYTLKDKIAWSQTDSTNYTELAMVGTQFEDVYGIYYTAKFVNEKLGSTK